MYRRCLGAHLRSTLEYERDFWILAVAALLTQGTGLIFLWTVFRSIPEINGWAFWDVALIYSLVVLSEGVAVLVGQGIWSLSMTVNLGNFDALLVRPFSPLLQVLSSQVGMNGLGNLALGGGLLLASLMHIDVPWSPGLVGLGIVLFMGAPFVKIGLNIVTNCAAFWLRTPWSMFAFSMHTFGELARFPITIYGPLVQLVLTLVLPYAFVSYFPASVVLSAGTYPWVGLLTPLVAAYCLFVGARVFRAGVARYESSGH